MFFYKTPAVTLPNVLVLFSGFSTGELPGAAGCFSTFFSSPPPKCKRRPLLICSKGKMTIGIKGWAAGWMCRGQTGSWRFPLAPSEPHTQLQAHVWTPEKNSLKGRLADTPVQAHTFGCTHTHTAQLSEKGEAVMLLINLPIYKYRYFLCSATHTVAPDSKWGPVRRCGLCESEHWGEVDCTWAPHHSGHTDCLGFIVQVFSLSFNKVRSVACFLILDYLHTNGQWRHLSFNWVSSRVIQ